MPPRPEIKIERVACGAASASAATVVLRLLGDPAIQLPDGSVRALEPRAAGLLALVALEPGITRARAAALLWPQSDDGRKALRQQLTRFRQVTGRALIIGHDALFLAGDVHTDLQQTPGGMLLGELRLSDCEEFDRWLERQRAQRRARLQAHVAPLLANAQAQRDAAAATSLLLLLQGAQADEEIHYRSLVQIHAERGDAAQVGSVQAQLQARLGGGGGSRPYAAQAPSQRPGAAAVPITAPGQPATPVALAHPPRLIGRAAELARVRSLWAAGMVVVVVAEAGMGKSRLVLELAQADARRCVRVSARPGDQSVPLAPLSRLLRAVVASVGHDAITQMPLALQRCVAALLPDVATALTITPAADAALLPNALEYLLARAPIESIIVDDLHFADRASCEVLRTMLAADAPQSQRWILARRPAEGAGATVLRDALADALRLGEVPLAPLDEAEVAALVDSLGLPQLRGAELASRLHRRSGGNPLFVLELLRHGGQHALPDAAPESVLSLIARRLHQSSPRAQQLVAVAAVAGQEFSLDLAQAVLSVRAVHLADAWAELEAAQVLDGARFAHDLVAEAAAKELPAADARRLHAAVAQHLASRQPAVAAARLAHHWESAGEPARALGLWRAAADEAIEASQRHAAAEAMQAAIRCADAAGNVAAAFDARIERCFIETSPDHAVQAHLGWLERMAKTPWQQARWRSAAAYREPRLPAALDHALEGLDLLRHVTEGDSQTSLQERLLQLVVSIASKIDRVDLVELHEPALSALVAAQEDSTECIFACRHLAIALNNTDRAEDAALLHDRALAFYARRGALAELASELTNAVTNSRERGRFALATAQLDEALRLLGQFDRPGLIDASARLAACNHWRDLGRFAAAFEIGHELIAAMPAGYRDRGLAHLAVAMTWHFIGQAARALQHLAQAEQAPSPYATFPARVLWLRAQIEQSLGRSGVELLHRAHEAAPSTSRRRFRWQIALECARAQGGAAGYARAAAVMEDARAVRSQSLQLLAECTLAACAPDPASGAAHGRCALTLLDNEVDASLVYKPQLWLIAAQAMAAVDEAQALRALRAAEAWIRSAAAQLSPELQPSFEQRHPINRALRELLVKLEHRSRGQ